MCGRILQDFAFVVDLFDTWLKRRTFDDGKVENEQSRKQNILCYHLGFDMHYFTSMPSEFEIMTDYIKIWCAVLVNDVFHDLSDLANLRTTWQARSAQLQLTVELYSRMD